MAEPADQQDRDAPAAPTAGRGAQQPRRWDTGRGAEATDARGQPRRSRSAEEWTNHHRTTSYHNWRTYDPDKNALWADCMDPAMSNQRAYDRYWRRCINAFNGEHPPGTEDAERDYAERASLPMRTAKKRHRTRVFQHKHREASRRKEEELAAREEAVRRQEEANAERANAERERAEAERERQEQRAQAERERRARRRCGGERRVAAAGVAAAPGPRPLRRAERGSRVGGAERRLGRARLAQAVEHRRLGSARRAGEDARGVRREREGVLVGAVDEARLAGIAVDPFQDRVPGVAARAIDLDADIRRLVQTPPVVTAQEAIYNHMQHTCRMEHDAKHMLHARRDVPHGARGA